MAIAYGDLISGISGDMVVGAFLDAGLPLARLRADLKKVAGLSFRLEVTRKVHHGIRATRFRVVASGAQPERSWKEIREMLQRSSLAPMVKETALDIFGRLAAAEGKIHGVAPARVRFHEIGAVDSIVDIVAVGIGVDDLKIDSFGFSPVPLGRGLASSRHGPLPLPGPATLELLRGFPVEWTSVIGETVTPTGAAIMAALGSPSRQEPHMTVERLGYGAGEREFPDRPNVFRLLVGPADRAWEQDEMLVIETNIDDMNPELYDYVLDRLFAAGARDVFLEPIQMKKNRPASLLRILAEPADKDKLAAIVFQETSTIGLRYYPVRRLVLRRSPYKVKTRFGTVSAKLIEEPGGKTRVSPEYDDLKKLAQRKKIPLKLLYDEVVRSFKEPERGKKV
jgi:uncharacterized protein (TIGR00299 family) protein